MPKSYKFTFASTFEPPIADDGLLPRVKQRTLLGIVPGPETHIRRSLTPAHFEDFESFDVEHEYTIRMDGRSFDTGESFTKIIARGEIKAFKSSSMDLLLLSGKKSDILDFCRQSEAVDKIALRTMQIDMLSLQEKLPSVRGAWFRLKQGFIRAKGYMGDQIQDTAEFCEAKSEGEISTLSFYFLDSRDGCMHPIMITEDGAVVLQRTYKRVEEELDLLLQIKKELLDSIFSLVEPTRSKEHVHFPSVS